MYEWHVFFFIPVFCKSSVLNQSSSYFDPSDIIQNSVHPLLFGR